MTPHLIIDCGRVLSALLVMADGQFVPCSQEIRQIATRHVSTGVLFDPRISEDPDFAWDEVLEALGKATPRNLFQRARRVGLRRPWDPQAAADTLLQLASPVEVLSSASALADRNAAAALPAVAFALLDALLDAVFAFVADRHIAPRDIDPVVILPAHASSATRLVLQKLFRRRGFRRLTIVRREIAAAMALVEDAPVDCLVLDAADDDLHLHRVTIDDRDGARVFRTASSTTIRALGWSHWSSRIAAALQTAPSAAFERGLLALLTGSPESLSSRVTHGALAIVLDDAWVAARTAEVRAALPEPLDPQRTIFAGEIFALDDVRKAFGAANAVSVPVLDHTVRGVALALRWLSGDGARQLKIARDGTLRVDTGNGEAVELLAPAQLPPIGESCHFTAGFHFTGEAGGTAFLLNLLWGADRAPRGNATVCALPLQLPREGGGALRLAVTLRRSRSGRRLSGAVEARMEGDVAVARAQFAEELEVTR
ncbi:MAG TPA: hypothetical protein VGR95_18355 [Thermoanaerobaculia bacterium]|jgi:hypothetical protein|nr:hypothetical protein [Thermoanaerobaculia bacterium]